MDIQAQYRTLEQLVADRRLLDAIAQLRAMSGERPRWSVTDAIRRVEESYTLMCAHAMRGLPDPGRPDMWHDLSNTILELGDTLVRSRIGQDAPGIYYSTLRYEALRRDDTLQSLVDAYSAMLRQRSDALLSGTELTADTLQQEEALWTRIFNRVWVMHPLTADQSALLHTLLTGPALPERLKVSLLWALFLGEMQYHDDARTALLLDALQGTEAMRLTALAALMLSRRRYARRPLRPALRHTLEAYMKDMPLYAKYVRALSMQLVRARDNERLRRSIVEDFLPAMMKFAPQMRDIINDTPLVDPDTQEMNPEWEDMLERTGMADKMREFSELQSEGSDVMLATFGALKGFPFFNDAANWFLPFTAEHSVVVRADEGMRAASEAIEQAPVLCSGDKYSMVLTLAQLPAQQRTLMVGQMRESAEQAFPPGDEHLEDDRRIELGAQHIVQTLYRFFTLFRRKGDFDNPFATPYNPWLVPDFLAAVDNDTTLQLVAEFYLRRGYYADAAELFQRLIARQGPEAPLYQKLGYSLQQEGDNAAALDAYQRAEMLQSAPSPWLTRRIAQVLRALKRYHEALPYLNTLLADKPDDPHLTLLLADCLRNTGRYAEALPLYYKLDFNGQGPTARIRRSLAWTLLLNGEYPRAAEHYARILAAADVTAADSMNAAHTELLRGEPARAAELYADAIARLDFDTEAFRDTFAQDLPLLRSRIADPLIIDITADRAAMLARERGTHI